MFHDRAHALCSRIAEEVREEIRRDQRKVKSANVGKLLREIDKDLLDPDIRVEALRLRRGIRDKNVSTIFNRELGFTPREYIIDKRMRIASRALASSKIEVWRIGVQVGYLTPGNFGRAFKEWGGKTPEEFRAEQAAAPADDGPPPLTLEEVEQALAGDLDEAGAAALIGRLDDLQDRIRDGYQALAPPAPDRALSERMMAAYLWRCIEHESHEIQQAAVEGQAADYHTPALFLLLSTASVEATEHDTERAIRLAELARASLRAIEEQLGDGAAPYQVRAHAVTAHAFTCAGRLDDAGRAFGDALEPFETMNDAPNPVVLAELTLYLGLYQAARGDHKRADKTLSAHGALMHQLAEWVEEWDPDATAEEAGEGQGARAETGGSSPGGEAMGRARS